MLIREGMTLEEVFQDFQHELRRGALDKKHPFRYITLATSYEGVPQARYVVLRKVDEFLNLLLYTDARTPKVLEIQANQQVSVLLYHPQKRVQVRIQADASIHQADELAKLHWSRVQGDAQKAYNSKLTPGTDISSPEDAFEWHEELSSDNFFAVVSLKPSSFELLQLNGLEHFRAKFEFTNERWMGTWLVP